MTVKISGAMQREINGRVNALPEEYQNAFYEISTYLYQFTTGEADVPTMQGDILGMFEAGARDGIDVFGVLGDDVAGFCDGLLATIPEQTWPGIIRTELNQRMHRRFSGDVGSPDGIAGMLMADQHSLPLSAALHLVPGVVIMAAYLGIGMPLADALGYPPYLALVIAMCAALAPIELGMLLWLGWKKNGKLSLRGIVQYREKPMKRGALIGTVAGLIVALVAVSILLAPIDAFVYRALFSWIPFESAAGGASGFLAGYPLSTVVVSLAAPLILTGVILPAIEELYFRGYLLPRLSRVGKWAPVVNQALFSLYHLWTPWQFISRIGFFLPTVWVTWLKKDLRVSLWVHCLSNTLITVLSIVAIVAGGVQ